MNRDGILAILRANLPKLREEYGVKSLALFGSAVRNEAGPESDVDLLVEFEPTAKITLFSYARLQRILGEALGGAKVDLVMRQNLYPELKPYIIREAVDV